MVNHARVRDNPERTSAELPDGRTTHGFSFPAAVAVVVIVVGCSVYANLSLMVADPENYKYFPPFKSNIDANWNDHLGAEYLNIAKAIAAGKGFSNPFGEDAGPTAWMAPVLPAFMATVLWLTDGDLVFLKWTVIVLKDLTLILTGLVVVALGRQASTRIGSGVAVVVFALTVWTNFRFCFQVTHDCWLVLLAMNGLVAGFCWYGPLQSGWRAAGWGIFGGLCAMVNPIVGMTWALLTLVLAVRCWTFRRLTIAALCSIVVVTPWTVRNYLLLGRWLAIKSNAMYEFYQSQCLQPDGLLQGNTFSTHPYSRPNRARYEYNKMGEIAFIDAKAELFWQAVRKNPVDFFDRVAYRFIGATLWYVPMNRVQEPRQTWVYWPRRITHPLACLALVVLIYSSLWQPLDGKQWVVIGAYICYLAPYILVSYYDRYAMPLIGVKALLIIWALDRLAQVFAAAGKEKTRQAGPAADAVS